MDQPKPLIWREPVKYEMGRMHFGRVSMSIATILIAYNVLAFFMFVIGVIGWSSFGSTWDNLGGTIFAYIGNTGAILFGLEVLFWILFGIGLGIRWVIKDIRVDGPGKD